MYEADAETSIHGNENIEVCWVLLEMESQLQSRKASCRWWEWSECQRQGRCEEVWIKGRKDVFEDEDIVREARVASVFVSM